MTPKPQKFYNVLSVETESKLNSRNVLIITALVQTVFLVSGMVNVNIFPHGSLAHSVEPRLITLIPCVTNLSLLDLGLDVVMISLQL